MTFRDHFSGVAASYAAFRPGYPKALFEWLASVAPGREQAWDCACGSGQVSGPLGELFTGVVATDASISQLASASALDHVSFAAASAESAPLIDRSVDLVTVGSALHWFAGDVFFSEVQRVLRPQGVLEEGSPCHTPVTLKVRKLRHLTTVANATSEGEGMRSPISTFQLKTA
jgi:ubiquinone/menaquinone biosynthesis C-methylase UbiE